MNRFDELELDLPENIVRHGFVGQYERKGLYSIDHVLKYVTQEPTGRKPNNKDRPVVIFDGDSIRMDSQRYFVFKNSIICSCCGLMALYFAKERSSTIDKKTNLPVPQGGLFHFNLYGINANGEEVLFTKDHIIPKSKGGLNHTSNYQTMCSPCNREKGNNHEVG